jgi:hypothetical protein
MEPISTVTSALRLRQCEGALSGTTTITQRESTNKHMRGVKFPPEQEAVVAITKKSAAKPVAKTKMCRGQCRSVRPFSDFNKNRTSSDGLQSYCRECSAVSKQKPKVDSASTLEEVTVMGIDAPAPKVEVRENVKDRVLPKAVQRAAPMPDTRWQMVGAAHAQSRGENTQVGYSTNQPAAAILIPKTITPVTSSTAQELQRLLADPNLGKRDRAIVWLSLELETARSRGLAQDEVISQAKARIEELDRQVAKLNDDLTLASMEIEDLQGKVKKYQQAPKEEDDMGSAAARSLSLLGYTGI